MNTGMEAVTKENLNSITTKPLLYSAYIIIHCTDCKKNGDLAFSDVVSITGVPNLFTISCHLGTPYCQHVPFLPEQLI